MTETIEEFWTVMAINGQEPLDKRHWRILRCANARWAGHDGWQVNYLQNGNRRRRSWKFSYESPLLTPYKFKALSDATATAKVRRRKIRESSLVLIVHWAPDQETGKTGTGHIVNILKHVDSEMNEMVLLGVYAIPVEWSHGE